MSDLQVCVTQLEGLSSDLEGIVAALTHANGSMQFDVDEVGGSEVHDALSHFDDNWDDRRELLARSVGQVAAMAHQSAEVFRDADDKLATSAAAILTGS